MGVVSSRMSSPASKRGGKGCGYVFLGLFAIAGALALIGLSAQVWEGMRSRMWRSTPATIVRSEVKSDQGYHTVDLEYVYTFNGHTYTGTRVKPGQSSHDHLRDATRVQQRYQSDRRVTCYVNPAAPAESYLEQTSLFYPLILLVPLLFLTIGVGGIWAMRQDQKPRAISERYRGQGAATFGARFIGALFMLIGGALLYGFTINPWLEARDSANWQEVPCTVVRSEVSSHRSSKGGTSYSAEILYEYLVDGRSYTSERFNFGVSTSGGSKSASQRASRFREGQRTVCYVDPNDPTSAVLFRESGFSWFALIPAVFFGVGVLIFFNAGKATGAAKSNPVPGLPSPDASGNIGGLRGTIGGADGPVTLAPGGSTIGAFIGLLIFALVWNGIVFGVLFGADVPAMAMVFLSIFGLIGLGIFAAAVHQFLALFNPRPTVQATSSAARLGESLEVRFSFAGRTQRIQRLQISLVAEEVATYRRGTDTHTDRHSFHETVLLETSDPALMRTGAVTLAIPANSMHSFDAPNNKILWKLVMHGEIPRWPDVKLDFPITVLPRRLS